MTGGPLTANDVVANLLNLSRQLDGNVQALKSADAHAVDARHEADLAYSRSFLTADGSVEHRKHTATIAVEKLEHEAAIAEAVVRHLRREADAIRTRIDVGRSANSALKAELSLASAGGAP